MYDRFLFVGLGGSGGKTLRFLKDQIRRWMRSCDFAGDVPAGWQFLHIDTPARADGDELNHLVPQLAPTEYLGLTRGGNSLRGIQTVLDDTMAIREDLRTWRVEPDDLRIPIDKGAGQFRAVGTSVGYAYVPDIWRRLQDSLRRFGRRGRACGTGRPVAESESGLRGG